MRLERRPLRSQAPDGHGRPAAMAGSSYRPWHCHWLFKRPSSAAGSTAPAPSAAQGPKLDARLGRCARAQGLSYIFKSRHTTQMRSWAVHSTPSSALMPRLRACPTPGRRIRAGVQTAPVAPDWRAGRPPAVANPSSGFWRCQWLGKGLGCDAGYATHPCTPACAPPGRAARQAQRARARRLLQSGAFRRCTQQRMAVAPPPLHFRPCKAPVQQLCCPAGCARCPGAAVAPERGAPRSRARDWRGRPRRHEAGAPLTGAAHGKEARRRCWVRRAGRARRPGAPGRAARPGCCAGEAPPARPWFEQSTHMRMAAAHWLSTVTMQSTCSKAVPPGRARAQCPSAAAAPEHGAPRSRAPGRRSRPRRHEAAAPLSGAARGLLRSGAALPAAPHWPCAPA